MAITPKDLCNNDPAAADAREETVILSAAKNLCPLYVGDPSLRSG
jgi:hypothetical protein